MARYNPKLTENQLEQLFGICRAVEQLRSHRNFLVHAEWHKLEHPGEHLGSRSSRPSDAKSEKSGRGTSELFVWTVKDAEFVADSYAQVAVALDTFIESAFPNAYTAPLVSRADSARIREMWASMLDSGWGVRLNDEASGTAPTGANSLD